MPLPIYLLAFLGAAVGIVVILRVPVRGDYLTYGRLRPGTVLLEYVMVLIWVAFGWANLPSGWPATLVGPFAKVLGWIGMVAGLLVLATAMLGLGIGRSHGIPKGGIQKHGLYRVTRNPQILGFWIFMLGFTILWPTWRTYGTLFLLAVLSHGMVLTEEEFLRQREAEDYEAFCREVPRYLGFPGRI
jgi:protein-S-isoprenylcysteine O-methyltransferase Ste14